MSCTQDEVKTLDLGGQQLNVRAVLLTERLASSSMDLLFFPLTGLRCRAEVHVESLGMSSIDVSSHQAARA